MKKSYKAFAVVFWIITVLIMGLIFYFSAQVSQESAEVSGTLLSSLADLGKNGFNPIGMFFAFLLEHFEYSDAQEIFRKMAHFSEYAGLGFFMAGSFWFTFRTRKFYLPLSVCVLYALSDEIHQIFVPGRACRLFDLGVDASGSLMGILVMILIITIIMNIKSKRQPN